MARKKRFVVQEVIHLVVKKVNRTPPKNDYLKHYPVVMRWALKKYRLRPCDFHMIAFLRSEHLFTKTDILRYANIFTWDKNRFHRLKTDGWIHEWRPKTAKEHAIYELTIQAKIMLDSVYEKLNFEEPIPTSPYLNPLFKRPEASYLDRRISSEVKRFNERIKKKRVV